MYLFEKSFIVIREPFLYFTIENALPYDIANKLLGEYFHEGSKVWKEFIDLHVERLPEIVDLFDGSFGLSRNSLSYEINFRHWAPNGGKIIRDWHIDGPSKKYQIIYYLGNPDTAGKTELSNKSGTQQKLLPFKHNRVLVFYSNHNQIPSWHRFFGTKTNHRLTFNMPLVYKS